MTTIRITRLFGKVMKELAFGDSGWRNAFIGKKRRSTDNCWYLLEHVQDGGYDERNLEMTLLPEDMVKTIIKLGWVARGNGRQFRCGYNWHPRFIITPKGRAVKLPAEKFWLDE
jgi:hypothetical protein